MLAPGLGGQGVVRDRPAGSSRHARLTSSSPAAIPRAAAASSRPGCTGGVDVAVGIVLQQAPEGAAGLGRRRRTSRAAASNRKGMTVFLRDVAGDVLLGVVGPHLLLVDVLLEDVAEHVGVDLVVRCAAGGRRGATGSGRRSRRAARRPRRGCRSSAVRLLDLVLREEAAVEVGDLAQQACRAPASRSSGLREALEEERAAGSRGRSGRGPALALAPPACCAGSPGRRPGSPSSG